MNNKNNKQKRLKKILKKTDKLFKINNMTAHPMWVIMNNNIV